MKKKLSIISFNTLGAPIAPWTVRKTWKIWKRYRAIVKELHPIDSDVIALQEVYTYGHVRLLKDLLKQHPYRYYKKSLLGPRGGLIIFSKLHMKPVNFLGFTTRGKYFSPSVIGHFMRNGVLICKIENTPFYVINVHLTPNLDMDWQVKNRFIPILQAQLDQISELITMLSDQGNEIVLVGDFNTAKTSLLYESFLTESILHDIFYDHDTPTVLQPLLKRSQKSARIDYIFVRNTVFSTKIHNKKHLFSTQDTHPNGSAIYLSDHIGLHAELEFQKKE